MAGKWEDVDYFKQANGQKALAKEFNFAKALRFVNKVGEIAEEQEHHPDISLGWGFVSIWLTTHSSHKVTDKDYKLAKAIDQL